MSQLSLPNLSEHPLVQRITRVRSRVRLAVALQAAGLLLSSFVGGFFLLMFLDYLIHFPSLLRAGLLLVAVGPASPFMLLNWYVAFAAMVAAIVVAVSAVVADHMLDLTHQRRSFTMGLILSVSFGVIGYLVWRHLLRPMSMRLTDQFLASRIENQNRELSDELMSALNFIHNRASSQNALAARHIDLAARRTEGIRFEDAVDFRRGFVRLIMAAAIMVFVAGVAALNPSLSGIAMQRWFSPADPRWPHITNVDFVWSTPDGLAPRVLPMGESITLHAVIDKGAKSRVLLTARTDFTPAETHPMTYTDDPSQRSKHFYEYTLSPEGTQLKLDLQAGDDRDVPQVTIRMAPRPVITQIQATVYPPAYAKDIKDPSKPASTVLYNLQSQTGHATQGSLVKLNIKSSKPFEMNAQGEPTVGFYDLNQGELLPLTLHRALLSPNEAVVSFIADKTLQGRLVMKDADALASRTGGTVTLEVIADAMPSIVITEPRNSVERAPDGFVDVSVQGTDDWGIAHLRFRADKYDSKPGDPHVFETPSDIPWQDLTADVASNTTTGRTKYTWDLAPLHLEPGARLVFYASVQDNYLSGTSTHDWVNSAPLMLQIRSTTDILEQNRKSLSDLNERIRSLKTQQEQTRLQTDAIRKIVDGAKSISPDQQNQLANLAQQQTQEAVTATAIKQNAAQIADDLRQNKMEDQELAKIAQDVSTGMADVGQQNMPRAGADLSQASQNATPPSAPNAAAQNAQQSAQSMSGATQQQDQAIAKMDDLIKKLGAIGDFESLRNETTKLLEQQKQVTARTQQLAPKVLGTPREALPKDLRDLEDKLAADQKNLGDRTADLLDRIDRASQPLSQSDPASAQSLQNASNIGRNGQIGPNQQSASSNISTNKTNDAGNNQQTAQQGLQNMLDELNKNDQRRLEQLAREVRELLAEVQKLREDQAAINTDTTTAGAEAAKAALMKIAEHQGRTQQNTIITEKKAENTRDAEQAAAYIQEASDRMGDSAQALYSSTQPPAIKPEADALTALDNAIDELKKLRDKVAPDSQNKQLAEFIKQYQAIQKDQITVKSSSDDLETKRLASEDKEFDRGDQLTIGGLAKSQGSLMDRMDALNKDPDLAKVDVIVWMNQQVTESMDTSKVRLGKEQLGKPTAIAQQAAIDRIQLIIDALKEEQQKPSEFNSPGGGGGGGGKPPLVPPIAQLKLLKAMQIVVNDQTKSVDQQLKTAGSQADKNEFQTQAQDLGSKEGRIHDMASEIVDQLLQNQRPPASQPASQPATRNAP